MHNWRLEQKFKSKDSQKSQQRLNWVCSVQTTWNTRVLLLLHILVILADVAQLEIIIRSAELSENPENLELSTFPHIFLWKSASECGARERSYKRKPTYDTGSLNEDFHGLALGYCFMPLLKTHFETPALVGYCPDKTGKKTKVVCDVSRNWGNTISFFTAACGLVSEDSGNYEEATSSDWL